MPAPAPLPWRLRADVFAQLATMEHAGLPPDRAFATLRLPGTHAYRLEQVRKSLLRGKSIAASGEHAGLFSPLEAAMISAACKAGSPAPVYRQLAERADHHDKLVRQIRAQMLKPALTLLAALLIRPLPLLASGQLSPLAYVLGVGKPLLCLWLLWQLLRWSFSYISSHKESRLGLWLLKMPVIGPHYLRHNRADFTSSLALLLAAGLPMFEAVPLALPTVHSAHLREQTAPMLRRLHRGDTLTDALAQTAWLAEPVLVDFVRTGEASGTLPEMLSRCARRDEADLAHEREQWAAWLPRLIYALLVIWIVSSLLGGNSGGPQLPADLE